MSKEDYYSDSIPRNEIDNFSVKNPIKKLHYLEEKYFIVIDISVARRLKFSESNIAGLYFEEVISEDCIILRPFKL
jgi:hypothetical protein